MNAAFDLIVKTHYRVNPDPVEIDWIVEKLKNSWFDGIDEQQLVESFRHMRDDEEKKRRAL